MNVLGTGHRFKISAASLAKSLNRFNSSISFFDGRQIPRRNSIVALPDVQAGARTGLSATDAYGNAVADDALLVTGNQRSVFNLCYKVTLLLDR
jgi:hypothetical protein